MSPVARVAVALRLVLVKRPWVHWLVVMLAAAGAAAAVVRHDHRIDTVRAGWGDSRLVWVAVAEHRPGDPLIVERRTVPAAVVADGALDEVDGLVARQHIGAGEIVDRVDVVHPTGPQAVTPAGWLAVPVTESPASGASLGDRVRVVGDGVVISTEAIVVGRHDDVTLVAVPDDEAPFVAADAVRVTLLLIP